MYLIIKQVWGYQVRMMNKAILITVIIIAIIDVIIWIAIMVNSSRISREEEKRNEFKD